METIKLDLIPGKKMPSLHASQFDDGRAHGIDLFENGVVYKLDGTETLTINERKGDDCICSLDIENTFAGSNHIVFASTEQMCAVWGNNICELVIKRGSVTLGTLNFILEIEPSPTEGGIESESEISNLERQITEITEQVIGDNYYTKTQTDEAIATATEDINNKIASEYDEEEIYYRGDIVLYNGVLYECDNTDASGEFIPSDWKEITLGEGIENVRDLLADYYTKSQSDYRFLGKTNPSGTGYFSLNRRGSAGAYSVSVGRLNEASAQSSFAEGENNASSGYASHSEGYGNNASGLMAHAEGVTTESSGYGSHSEGVGTIANHIGQHAIGTYNVADPSTADPTAKGNYIEIVGNGTDDNRRRNARTLDWQGNEMLAGDLTFNGNKSLTSEISRLDGKIDNLPAPMIFKGTLGVGGTIQSLPTASASNEGFTYKVITDGTYAGQTAKVGDVFTSNGFEWVLIPAGDEDNDTWRAIKINGVEKLGNGISSGAVDFEDTANVKFEFDANGNKVRARLNGIYTESEVDNLLDEKADKETTYTKEQVDDIVYNILPDDTASGSVANFTTSLELPIKLLEVDVNAVQSAGTPTPSSPKAISGRSAISLVHCHKNLYQYDESKVKTGTTTTSTIRAYYPLGFKGVTSLTFTANLKSGSSILTSDYLNIGKLRKSDGLIEILSQLITPDGITTRTISISSDDDVVLVSLENPTVIKSILSRYDIQIEVGSQATEYEPYNGNVTTIPLGQTVYGGSINLTTGLLRITKVKVVFNGDTPESDLGITVNAEFSQVSWAPYITIGKGTGVFKSNIFKDVLATYKGLYKIWNNRYLTTPVPRMFMGLPNTVTTKAEAVAWFANNPTEVVYELATPIEIQLTPTQVTTLIGTNNIFADTGDTSVVFKDSVNGYVEKKIASVQALALNT